MPAHLRWHLDKVISVSQINIFANRLFAIICEKSIANYEKYDIISIRLSGVLWHITRTKKLLA